MRGRRIFHDCKPNQESIFNENMRALLIVLTFLIILVGCGRSVGSGDGRVLDLVSQAPIADAWVTMRCVNETMKGSTEKIFMAQSRAPDGQYHFDPNNFRHCDWIFWNQEKPGYKSAETFLSGLPESSINRSIPKAVYLVTNQDYAKLDLQRVLTGPGIAFVAAGESPAVREINSVYQRFLKSEKIAVDPALAAWVREHYCGRLTIMYSSLSKREREELDANAATTDPLTGSFANEALLYCRGS
jgi:hypothetical protein